MIYSNEFVPNSNAICDERNVEATSIPYKFQMNSNASPCQVAFFYENWQTRSVCFLYIFTRISFHFVFFKRLSVFISWNFMQWIAFRTLKATEKTSRATLEIISGVKVFTIDFFYLKRTHTNKIRCMYYVW